MVPEPPGQPWREAASGRTLLCAISCSEWHGLFLSKDWEEVASDCHSEEREGKIHVSYVRFRASKQAALRRELPLRADVPRRVRPRCPRRRAIAAWAVF